MSQYSAEGRRKGLMDIISLTINKLKIRYKRPELSCKKYHFLFDLPEESVKQFSGQNQKYQK